MAYLGPYAGVDYNLTLCRLQHIYHGQPYARVDLIPSQGLRISRLGPVTVQVLTSDGQTP
jgi:hypothetical protein